MLMSCYAARSQYLIFKKILALDYVIPPEGFSVEVTDLIQKLLVSSAISLVPPVVVRLGARQYRAYSPTHGRRAHCLCGS